MSTLKILRKPIVYVIILQFMERKVLMPKDRLVRGITAFTATVFLAACDGQINAPSASPDQPVAVRLPAPSEPVPFLGRAIPEVMSRFPRLSDFHGTSQVIQTHTRAIKVYNFTNAQFNTDAASSVYRYLESLATQKNLPNYPNISLSPIKDFGKPAVFILSQDHPAHPWTNEVNPLALSQVGITVYPSEGTTSLVRILDANALEKYTTGIVGSKKPSPQLKSPFLFANTVFVVEACNMMLSATSLDQAVVTPVQGKPRVIDIQERLCNSLQLAIVSRLEGKSYPEYESSATAGYIGAPPIKPIILAKEAYQQFPSQPILTVKAA